MSLLLLLTGKKLPKPDRSIFGDQLAEFAGGDFAYWPLSDEPNGRAHDVGGLGFDLDAGGDPTFESAGLVPASDGSVAFDGNGYSLEGTGGPVGGLNPTFTAGAIVQTSLFGLQRIIMQQRDAVAFQGQWVMEMTAAGYLRAWAYNVENQYEYDLTGFLGAYLNDGQPHLVGLVVDGTADTATLWVDGVQANQDPDVFGGTYSAAINMCIGYDCRDANKSWNGNIDEAFVLPGVALTQADWDQLLLVSTDPIYVEPASFDGSTVPLGPAAVELASTLPTEQEIEVATLDASSVPAGVLQIYAVDSDNYRPW
jgi:hypothetical protein